MSKIAEAMQGAVYGGMAGFKEPSTSRNAAAHVSKTLSARQAIVLQAFTDASPDGLTPDEAAMRLGISVLAVRPRVTELGPSHLGLLVPTGKRRANGSGLMAKVYRSA